ncbi:hypothetical protein C0J52_09857 [Blattella germanica]|nr:hypothetical protein C0J52_09857 [Blattella germanica]
MLTTSVDDITSSQRQGVCVKGKASDDQECLRRMFSVFGTLSYVVLKSQLGRPVANLQCQ